jgi:epoxyqueuosine reductase
MIAIGNSGDIALAAKAEKRLGDPSPLVRGAAVWALSRLLTHDAFAALAAAHGAAEHDPTVRAEWAAAQGQSALG